MKPPPEPRSVLLIDDDDLFVDATAEMLRQRGFAVETAYSLGEAAAAKPARFDCVVADHRLPDGSGLGIASHVGDARPRLVLITASPRLDVAIEALRLGFDDFLTKPLDLDELLGAIQRRGPPSTTRDGEELTAPSMAGLAGARCPVLIVGETGSGKGYLARTLHAIGSADAPFVSVNCAAVPSTLFESELFGVESGAFTGALERPGLVEAADGGTLFLDEIAELPQSTQAKLLTFLDDGTFRRVGGARVRSVRVRVVAATSRDIDADVASGAFRGDLLHRLDVARVQAQPLRVRADFAEVAHAIVGRLAARDQRAYALAPGEIELLRRHAWPGNVRELQNVIERSIIGSPPGALVPSQFVRSAPPGVESSRGLSPPDVQLEPRGAPEASGDLRLERIERDHVKRVLALCNGNRMAAAASLGISVSTLRRKLAEWALD